MDPLFDFFNKERPVIEADESKWPAEWKIIEFKTYPRFPQIKLPRPQLKPANLRDVIIKRHSVRFFAEKSFNAQQISNLLFYSCGITKRKKEMNKSNRAYPSGGRRYPIEIYLAIFSPEKKEFIKNKLQAGLYHYNVLNHSLEKILNENRCSGWEKTFKGALHFDFAKKAGGIILMTCVKQRTLGKYGNLAYKFALLEGGHIAQNIYLLSTVNKIGCCALGAVNEKIIHELLDIDGISECVFYALAIGNMNKKQKNGIS